MKAKDYAAEIHKLYVSDGATAASCIHWLLLTLAREAMLISIDRAKVLKPSDHIALPVLREQDQKYRAIVRLLEADLAIDWALQPNGWRDEWRSKNVVF
jgi:hypothetical protein